MSTFKSLVLLGAVLAWGLLPSRVAAQTGTTGADTIILNGVWDTTAAIADNPGEMTCELTATGFTSVITGIPRDSIFDSIRVDTGFAFSSLDSLDVLDDTVANTAYDTIYFQYAIQNQGNATDSFTIVAGVHDTTNNKYFTPVDFSWVSDTAGADVVVGSDNNIDSAWYGIVLPQEGIDTFFVRVVLPGPLNASDEDSLLFDVHLYGHYGTGVSDAWPDTLAGRVINVVIDTVGNLWHTHADSGHTVDTLWDYGDYQRVTNYLTINAPVMRLRKSVNATGSLPGDTLTYSIYYENDGSAATEDTVNIVDMLPRGVMYLDTITCQMDSGATHNTGIDKVDVDYWYNGAWREDMPQDVVTSDAFFDTLNAFMGVRFQVPAGIGRHDTTGEAGTDTKAGILANGDSLDKDAGYVTFKVRIR